MKSMIDFELSTNPNILFDELIEASQISLNHYRIGDSVANIDKKLIEITAKEIYPRKVDGTFVRGDKVFVVINKKKIEFTLQERIEAVILYGGGLGFKNGSGYVIKDTKIASFEVFDLMLAPYVKFSKKELIKSLGTGTKEINIYDRRDGYLDRTEIINSKRQITIIWDDSRRILKKIIIG